MSHWVYPDDYPRNYWSFCSNLFRSGRGLVSGRPRRRVHWSNRGRDHNPSGVGFHRTSSRAELGRQTYLQPSCAPLLTIPGATSALAA